MTKDDLFIWAYMSAGKYPALAGLKEENQNDTSYLKLTVPETNEVRLLK